MNMYYSTSRNRKHRRARRLARQITFLLVAFWAAFALLAAVAFVTLQINFTTQ